MNVESDTVARFHYELGDDNGESIEISRGGDGVATVVGHGNVIPGLDAALRDHSTGDQFAAAIAPTEAYGLRRDNWIGRISRKRLASKRKPKVGDVVSVRTGDGIRQVTMGKVGNSVVDVDLNHPLAGRTRVSDIEILDVRAGTPEESQHTHVHGTGGVHH